ncbi:adenylate/guanylate cyclase domain-containing protein [Leptospira bandrabouensis]|uniref:adenylate/guanylate cyclase domain-containing protein n=1 Tax=Leptospira bandrabouensis TaxID=2484903 RepID=UPI001EE8DA7E|nr:adenylate/guanylate cyclase domain-containing protein [Leptospira bandrabouensis]MCG6145690.1 adenylate/guanylate cyclase domain-containing protein [Leptospira bandrabouensis]MCG6160767.1 adenylate/guanylate cyclase domain-containing protein [Leptospira bandrabouensis]MCG6165308.1 adenylate/guanylate cyclase domain-containing protein [Leptospira bandrabouensis]
MVFSKRLFSSWICFLFFTGFLSNLSAQVLLTNQILDLRSETSFGQSIHKWSFKPGDSPLVTEEKEDDLYLDEESGQTKALRFLHAQPILEESVRNGWISGFQIQTAWDKVRDGDGEFYFPDFHKYRETYKGYGWYRTEILITEEDIRSKFKSRNLTLRLGQISQADAVYWNGKFIGGTGLLFDTEEGSELEDKSLYSDKIRFYQIPTDQLKTDEPNVLAVRVYAKYPLSPGLSHDKFYISSVKYSERAEYWNDFKKIFVIVLTLLLGSFYLYWQFLFRSEDDATIYFALGSIFMALNTLFQSQIIYSVIVDGFWIKKIEYFAWIGLVHLLFNFIVRFAHVRQGWIKITNRYIDGAGVLSMFVVLFSPNLLFLSKFFFYWSFVTILLGGALFYIIFLGRKVPSIGTVSLGFCVFVLLIMNDVFVEMQWEWYPSHTFLKDYAFAAFSISVALSIVKNMIDSRRLVEKQREEKDRLSRYFSPAVMETIVADNIKLGGEEKHIATLFSDIVGFTTFAEKNPPGVVLQNLNTIFESLSDLIFHYSATLDKFIGDAIMAFWGAPKQTELDAYHAIACAVDMQKKMEEINRELGVPPGTFRLRIGVNFGEAIVGNIGSVKRMDYTVIGDAVNTAARLESHGIPGKVAVSEAAFLAAGGAEYIEFEDTKELTLKGKVEPVKVYFVTKVKPRPVV